MTKNPFIQAFEAKTFSTRDEAVPFDKIGIADYVPALDWAIEKAKNNVSEIKTKAANFENTILGLETASEFLETVAGVYFNLLSAEASEAHQALAKEISPKMAAYQSDISLDEALFKKIKEVHDTQSAQPLSAEQKALVDKFYKDFVRNGALLSATDKETLRKIDQELSALGPQFSENVLKATNAFEILIEDRCDIVAGRCQHVRSSTTEVLVELKPHARNADGIST